MDGGVEPPAKRSRTGLAEQPKPNSHAKAEFVDPGGTDVKQCPNDVTNLAEQPPTVTLLEAAAAESRGARQSMEDAWVVNVDSKAGGGGGPLRCAYFAVFDGHGGRKAADYAREHLHASCQAAGLPRELVTVKATKKAIIEGMKQLDDKLLQESVAGNWQDGATAVCVWILGQKVFVANVGDAKAVLARTPQEGEGGPLKGIILSREHKAIFPGERSRIEKAGGYVAPDGRILGRLEVSRALGDRPFKKVGVVAVPDINVFEISPRDKFLILACDGLWTVFAPGDAVQFVEVLLKEGMSVELVSRRLVREAVLERGCKDNCTAVIVVFKDAL